MLNLIPKPASIFESDGEFIVSSNTKIVVQKEKEDSASIGNLLSGYLRQIGGFEIAVLQTEGEPGQGDIHVALTRDEGLGEEGYELSITPDSIQIRANCAAGLFYGVQTLRQLLSGAFACPLFPYATCPGSTGVAQCSTWRATSSAWTMQSATSI